MPDRAIQPDDVWSRFQQLPQSDRAGQIGLFRAAPLRDHEDVFLAKDESARPLFLVSTNQVSAARAVQLDQLRIGHGIRARLEGVPGAGQVRQMSLIECRSDTAELQRLFVECFENALPRTIAGRSAEALNRLVTQLVALFAAASSTPDRPLSGLWAELFVISQSTDPARAIRAWHQQSDEHFDFSEGSERLEVKAGRSHERRHHFSLEQANPPTDLLAYVISVVADPAAQGPTIGDLRSRCLDAMGADLELRAKIDRLCVQYLGGHWERGLASAFDEVVALESLRLYDLRTIPRIPAPPPVGVSEVSFVSSLELAMPVAAARLPNGSLAQTLVGRRVST